VINLEIFRDINFNSSRKPNVVLYTKIVVMIGRIGSWHESDLIIDYQADMSSHILSSLLRDAGYAPFNLIDESGLQYSNLE
jgi:hypothetical protein